MVDFIKVKISRLSDSVFLQHLWNSIDDINLSGLAATKANVIERCEKGYGMEPSEINKNLFLALKEGTITRSMKTDILSRVTNKEDRSQGDWYCFLCHKCGPDTRCQKCDTSFHSNCNSDLFDQFHCHTCRQSGQFYVDFQKFSISTQSQIIDRIIHSNKLKWKSLNVVGYIKDTARNNFFLYKIINSSEIDDHFACGRYFSSVAAGPAIAMKSVATTRNEANFLFHLLLLRHNCAVIYGIDHAFYKMITGYIKHLHVEMDNIYCDSCYVLFTKGAAQKLNSAHKQDLFCSVCTYRHPVMWGLVPPNIFWPFKVISHDPNRFYGIKFSSGSAHFSRHKIESFTKETCLVWSSYNPKIADRPTLELLKAFSLAQKYAQNLAEVVSQKCPTTLVSLVHNKRRKKSINNDSSNRGDRNRKKSKCKKKLLVNNTRCPEQRKVGRPALKRKVGRPPLKKKMPVEKNLEKKELMCSLSSTTDSSSIGLCNRYPLVKGKRSRNQQAKIANVFVSSNSNSDDTEKSDVKPKPSKRPPSCVKRKNSCRSKYTFLSSTNSESDSKHEENEKNSADSECRFSLNSAMSLRQDYVSSNVHKPGYVPTTSVPSEESVSHTSQLFSKYNQYAQNYTNAVSCSSEEEEDGSEDSYSSDATIPHKLGPVINNNSRQYSNHPPGLPHHNRQHLLLHLQRYKEPLIPIVHSLSQSDDSDTEDKDDNDDDDNNHKAKRSISSSKYRSQCDMPTSSKYSAYSPSPSSSQSSSSRSRSRSSHSDDVANPLSINNEDDEENDHQSLKAIFTETTQGFMHSYKEGGSNTIRMNNLETGLYCSSSSPVNFSPMSVNQHTILTQFSVQSTPCSNYQMSCDEVNQSNSTTSSGQMKLNWKHRAQKMPSPLSLVKSINPKVDAISRVGIKKNCIASKYNPNSIISGSSSDNDF